VVRTTLVELVAEMRAGMPLGSGLPSHEAAEQAVDVAINRKRNRVVVVNQVASDGQVAATAGVPRRMVQRPNRLHVDSYGGSSGWRHW
jgi:hypothetical protein